MRRFVNMAKSGRMAAHRKPAPPRLAGRAKLRDDRGRQKPALPAGPGRSRPR